MSLSGDERVRRVHAVLDAARRLANPDDPLGREARGLLPDATGLSPEGVELGLSRHMELEVSPADLRLLLMRAGSAPRVHVVLSANIFVGAVRAIALAVAAAPSVRVRSSRRESVMAPLLARALDQAASSVALELTDILEPAACEEVHVYGRRETIAALTRAAQPGVIVRGHGPGFGVALIDARTDDLATAASLLSWDVVAFDQRGCLSPKIAFVMGSRDAADSFGEKVALELQKRGSDIARGQLGEDELGAQTLYRRTLEAVGCCHVGASFMVGVDPAPRGLVLPPSGRHLHVVQVSSEETLGQLLQPFSGSVTCVGRSPSTFLSQALLESVHGARFLPLGSMQSPPLDGPVDLRGVV